jgi:hypothetical protein
MMTPALEPGALYLGDNGRVFCARLDHAGMTAHFTGRDRSGRPVHQVAEADQREARRLGATLACEGCRR